MEQSKITNIEVVALLLIVLVNRLILNLPQNILQISGSASIINTIYIFLLALLFCFAVHKLFKPFANSDIIDVSEYLGGKFLKWCIGIICIVYLLTVAGVLMRDFSEFIQIVHFSKFPVWFLLVFFSLVAIIGNFFGLKSILRTNLIVVPIALFGFLVTFLSIAPDYHFERIFPLLGNGANETFLLGASNLFAYSGLIFLFFINPLLKDKENQLKVSIVSIIIIGIFVILSVASLLFAFPFIFSVEELSPLYYVTSIAGSNAFIQRPEAFFIIGWILSVMTYISIIVAFITLIIKKFCKVKLSNGISIPISIIIFLIALLPQNILQIRFIQNFLYKYCSVFLIFVVFLFILLAANIKKRKRGELHE